MCLGVTLMHIIASVLRGSNISFTDLIPCGKTPVLKLTVCRFFLESCFVKQMLLSVLVLIIYLGKWRENGGEGFLYLPF